MYNTLSVLTQRASFAASSWKKNPSSQRHTPSYLSDAIQTNIFSRSLENSEYGAPLEVESDVSQADGGNRRRRVESASDTGRENAHASPGCKPRFLVFLFTSFYDMLAFGEFSF